MSNLIQPTLFKLLDMPSVNAMKAIETLASSNDIERRGAFFTRIEVVEFILDLVGYTVNEPLHFRHILEPSFGKGDFLLPIIKRLLVAWRKHNGNTSSAFDELKDAVRGVELHKKTFASTRTKIINQLKKEGFSTSLAKQLSEQWLVQGDFLLTQQNSQFDFVVGNPPYVRQELIPTSLLSEYRRRYKTMYDRADLYIPFIERSLSLLNKRGTLGLICPNRWMKNRYGGPLREYISKDFHLKTYIDMVNTNAFYSTVNAYPAIIIITKEKANKTRIAYRPQIEKKVLASIAAEINAEILPQKSSIKEIIGVMNGSEPWLLDSSEQMTLIRRIESQFLPIEQTGCKVGIGVATGADKAFIGNFDSLDVEPDRKLPLVTTHDLQSGKIIWQGQGIINPFANDGSLVELKNYPKLARFLEARKTIIAKRYCARKNPSKWYRTIDRIWPSLTQQPKLLIPDIKGEAHIVFDPGHFYPHHNLYYITSDTWDLRALQAVLLSSIAKLFVVAYSTQMRGGYLRFQAQYLRRIRLPLWQDVSQNLRQELIHAANTQNLEACNRAVVKLYQLTSKEQNILSNNGSNKWELSY